MAVDFGHGLAGLSSSKGPQHPEVTAQKVGAIECHVIPRV